jgi:hypothetical protein
MILDRDMQKEYLDKNNSNYDRYIGSTPLSMYTVTCRLCGVIVDLRYMDEHRKKCNQHSKSIGIPFRHEKK